MKSSNEEPEKINELLDELCVRLGATLSLMDSFQSRDEGYYTKMAADTQTVSQDNSPGELVEHYRRLVLRHLIFCFRPLKKLLKTLDPEIPIETLERLVDELWEVERGGRNWLLKRPKGLGRGNRPSVATSIKRVSLVIEYEKLLKKDVSKQDALTIISEESGLPVSTVQETIKDIREFGKDNETTELYRVLSQHDRDANELIRLYKSVISTKRG